jgi:hypothetical protein
MVARLTRRKEHISFSRRRLGIFWHAQAQATRLSVRCLHGACVVQKVHTLGWPSFGEWEVQSSDLAPLDSIERDEMRCDLRQPSLQAPPRHHTPPTTVWRPDLKKLLIRPRTVLRLLLETYFIDDPHLVTFHLSTDVSVIFVRLSHPEHFDCLWHKHESQLRRLETPGCRGCQALGIRCSAGSHLLPLILTPCNSPDRAVSTI